MIARLKGRILEKQPPFLVLDVNGVGYEVEAPMSTFFDLPAADHEVILLTHMVVRDDAQLLFGFATEGERRLFRELIRISGVGAKMALAILSGISVQDFVACVNDNDTAALVRVPGIGKKTAQRLIMEMRDRLGEEWAPADLPARPAAGGAAPATGGAPSDAVAALVALGYKPAEAERMIKAVPDAESLGTEDMIRIALRGAAR